MKDVLNDFKSCGRPMTKNELKIKEFEKKYDKALTDLAHESHKRIELEEDLDAEKSTNANLSRRILKALEYIEQWRDTKTKRIDSRLKRTLEILKGEENERNN